MKVRMESARLREFVVSSESEADAEYHVDLCAFPLGADANGITIFNGSCGFGDINGCADFRYRCLKNLKHNPERKMFRCKHIKAARQVALDIVLQFVEKTDPNQ
jgi:hypothetical protein